MATTTINKNSFGRKLAREAIRVGKSSGYKRGGVFGSVERKRYADMAKAFKKKG